MKNISLILASALSIAFIISIVDKAIARPTESKLPKVGIVKNTDVTHGCYYYQPDKITKKLEENRNNLIKQSTKLYKKEKSQQKERLLMQNKLDENVSFFEKKAIFSLGGNQTMNLNGEDTVFSSTGNSNTYKAAGITMKLSTSVDNNFEKGTISIESNGSHKIIKIRGICFH